MRFQWASLLILAACGYDTSTTVNVAPSAEPHVERILDAVARLNEMAGDDTYVVKAVDSEGRVDGEIVMRGVEDLGIVNGHERRIGNTRKTRRGVIVRIVPSASAQAIAHELGHAAGLEHESDEDNLMYRKSRPDVWHLTETQIAKIRGPFRLPEPGEVD